MNFLAHLYLSGGDEEVMMGNFIADFVKGRLTDTSGSAGIVKGIRLHRYIDHFTDTHETVRLSKVRLRPVYHKYAGVITDMYYDHFLAANWPAYNTIPLTEFADRTYAALHRNRHLLPTGMERLVHYMVRQNWLVSYARIEGIERALQGMARRTTFESGMERASAELKQDYGIYQDEFRVFFPQLIAAAQQYLLDNEE
jgi:acyl carrier protein phosphodiesterase